MTNEVPVAFVLPGQGAYRPGFAAELRAGWTAATEVFARVETVVRESGHPSMLTLLDREPGLPELLAGHWEVLQFTLFTTAVAMHDVLVAEGLRPAALMGHSFGEIAALCCGKAFSVEDGARIVHARNLALRSAPAGAMAGLATDAEGAAEIAGQVPGTTIACVNSASQHVLSGAVAEMGEVVRLARERGVDAVLLSSNHAFHHPVLATAAEPFRGSVAHLARVSPTTPVFSPIQGEYYGPGDDVAALLAGHLTRPVRFAEAVDELTRQGISDFVECGASTTLASLVRSQRGTQALGLRYRPGHLQEDMHRMLDRFFVVT
jgi:acyl transferase domain-containing protein